MKRFEIDTSILKNTSVSSAIVALVSPFSVVEQRCPSHISIQIKIVKAVVKKHI